MLTFKTIELEKYLDQFADILKIHHDMMTFPNRKDSSDANNEAMTKAHNIQEDLSYGKGLKALNNEIRENFIGLNDQQVIGYRNYVNKALDDTKEYWKYVKDDFEQEVEPFYDFNKIDVDYAPPFLNYEGILKNIRTDFDLLKEDISVVEHVINREFNKEFTIRYIKNEINTKPQGAHLTDDEEGRVLSIRQKVLILNKLGVFDLPLVKDLTIQNCGILFGRLLNKNKKNTEDAIRERFGELSKKQQEPVLALIKEVGLNFDNL